MTAEGEHIVKCCEKCGKYHERRHPRWGGLMPTCVAHRTNGEPCMNNPRKGGTLCAQRHGKGSQVVNAAKRNHEREEAEKRMARELAKINPNPKFSNPLEGLMWEVAISAQAVEWCAEQLSQLTVPDPQQSGIPDTVEAILNEEHPGRRRDRMGRPIIYQDPSAIWGANHEGDGAPHVLWVMWNDERERHVRICAAAIKAGVSERMVALAEHQGSLVVRIVSHMLENLGLDELTRERGRRIAATEMRRLAALQAPLNVEARQS